jgi:hypothetical protein
LPDDARCERDQFHGVFAKAVGVARAPPIVDLHVAAGGPAPFLQSLQERRVTRLRFRIVSGERAEHPDAPHPLGLLGARGERPRGYTAADQCDEVPPPHGAYPEGQGSRTNYSTMHRSKKQLLMSALGHSRLIDMLETPL